MHGDATDIAIPDLDFAGVQASTQRRPDVSSGGAERQRAMDCATGSIEGCQNSVARALDQNSTMLADEPIGEVVIAVRQLPPASITYF
jgi:hypothetical protein